MGEMKETLIRASKMNINRKMTKINDNNLCQKVTKYSRCDI